MLLKSRIGWGAMSKRSKHSSADKAALDTESQTVTTMSAALALAQYWARWTEENRSAIAHYNARVQKEGLPLEEYRTF